MANDTTEPTSGFDRALATLAALSHEGSLDTPSLVMRLRKLLPDVPLPELSLAAETYAARHSAPAKLGEWAKDGFFSASLLEQASRESIAHYRAQMFAGLSHVLEVGTGTGADTAALARVCLHVTTIDGDAVASDLARRNLALQGITNVTFLVGEAQSIIPTLPKHFDGFFADPARRSKGGERFKDADDYSPPLSFVLSLEIGTVRAVKVSPGLFIDPPPGWSRQFVGFQSECLEQTLWFGAHVPDSSVVIADTGSSWAPKKTDTTHELVKLLPDELVGSYLLEAHGTINRSQFLQEYFGELHARMIATDIAYAVTPTLPSSSPLVRAYRIIDCIPFSIKRLKAALRERGWSNRTELKKRNFPRELEQIRAELKLPSHSHNAPFGVLFFFKNGDTSWVVLAERCSE